MHLCNASLGHSSLSRSCELEQIVFPVCTGAKHTTFSSKVVLDVPVKVLISMGRLSVDSCGKGSDPGMKRVSKNVMEASGLSLL